jgi:hypothetical protein
MHKSCHRGDVTLDKLEVHPKMVLLRKIGNFVFQSPNRNLTAALPAVNQLSSVLVFAHVSWMV